MSNDNHNDIGYDYDYLINIIWLRDTDLDIIMIIKSLWLW